MMGLKLNHVSRVMLAIPFQPQCVKKQNYPDSKVHGANMGPTWVLSAPDGPHVGPMNLAIWIIREWNSPLSL